MDRAARRALPVTPLALQLVAGRWRARWRLQLALLLTAVLSATALCALAQLTAATGPAGVRAALAGLPVADRSVDVQVTRPDSGVGALRAAVRRAAARATGLPAEDRSAAAVSRLLLTDDAGGATVLLAAADDPGAVARLTDGRWPSAADEAVVPEAAARTLGLGIGDRIATGTDPGARRGTTVTGLYRPRLDAPLWREDPLRGVGADPAFTDPDSSFATPGPAFGPLLVTPAGLDGLPLQVVDLRVVLDPRGVPADRLREAAARVEASDDPIALAVGRGALSVGVVTALPEALRGVASGVDVAHVPAVVTAGLLAALAGAVLLGVAGLLAEARAGEQLLLARRGAGRRRLAGLVAVEAMATGAVVAVAAPLLAVPVAGLAGAVGGLLPGTVAVALVAGGVVAAVLVGAAARPAVRDRAGRAPRLSAVARSGLDLAVVAAAVVLVQRLLSTDRPPTGPALAAPVLVLVAAALAGRRLVGPVGRVAEPLVRRTRAAGPALAALELSRRARRAAAAVLVVALGTSASAFALAQLATRDRSQHDQAAFAVGAPARSATGGGGALVLRPDGLLAGADGGSGTASVAVVALPPAARALLGGSAAALAAPPPAADLGLPAAATRLRVAIAAASTTAPRPDGVVVRALVRDGDGMIGGTSGVRIGTGSATAALPLPEDARRLAGLEFALPQGDDAVRLRIAAVTATGPSGTVRLQRPDGWSARSSGGATAGLLQGGFGDVSLSQPSGGARGGPVLRLLSWPEGGEVPVVADRSAARTAGAASGGRARLVVDGADVPASIAAVVAHAPASLPVAGLRGRGAVSRGDVVLADRERLQRALVDRGSAFADDDGRERWAASAARLAAGGGAPVDVAGLAARLRSDPLLVAVRPALGLLAVAGGVLAVVAFLAQVAASRSERRYETAQLRAAGMSRTALAALDLRVAGALLALGAAVGLPSGLLAASWTAPRAVADPVGGPPVPPAVFDPAALPVAVAAAAVVTVCLLAVAGTALAARRDGTAALLRAGDEP